MTKWKIVIRRFLNSAQPKVIAGTAGGGGGKYLKKANEMKWNQLNFLLFFVTEKYSISLLNVNVKMFTITNRNKMEKNYRWVHYHHDFTIKISILLCFIKRLNLTEHRLAVE